MEVQDFKKEITMIYSHLIFNLTLGLSINIKISPLILEMDILCLFFKIRFISLEDGITKLNLKIYLSMTLKLRCGLILKLEPQFLHGTMLL